MSNFYCMCLDLELSKIEYKLDDSMLINSPVAGFILVDFDFQISDIVCVLTVKLILKLSYYMIFHMANWVRIRHSK